MRKKRLTLYQCIGLMPMLMAALLLCACGDDAEGRIEIDDAAPAQVTNVNATPAAGAVTLTWNIPTSGSFMYTKVAYTDADGKETYQMFSKERADVNGQMTATFKGFVETSPVKFLLYACSVRGNNQGAVEIAGTPGEPNFTKVLDKVTISQGVGGVTVSCTNDYDETVVVGLSWKSAANGTLTGSTKYTVGAKTSDTRFVRLDVAGGFLQEASVVSVHTEDEYGHASSEKTFEVTPKRTVKIDQSLMSIPGYNASSNDGTAGYSSQESQGEGATNGRAVCLLDGNTATFWHSSWKVATDYPQWFVVDLGKEYPIANVELTRRIGNDKGQVGQTIFTCTEANAANSSNSDNWGWENQGSFGFNIKSDAPQTCDLSKNLPTARYIKVYFGEEMKGNGNYAMVSEFNVYTVEQ